MQQTGLVGTISGGTIWRWLSKDAELAHRLHNFESHFAKIGKPFEWTLPATTLTKGLELEKLL